MALPRLVVTVRDSVAAIERLERFRIQSQGMRADHQYLIAELIMLRLFAILEAAIENLACKLGAGATYINGVSPNRIYNAQSVRGARDAMEHPSGTSERITLRWTSSRDVRKSTSGVLESNEPFLTNVGKHASILTEMRKVRNFLAHRSSNSRSGFKEVVRSVYGANSRVRVEAFLTSQRKRPVAKIDEYITSTKVMIQDLAYGTVN